MLDYTFLALHVRFLKIARLWPLDDQKDEDDDRKWKQVGTYFFFWSLIPTTIPLTWEILSLLVDSRADLTELIEPLLAWVCLICEHYLASCFLANRILIRQLQRDMGNLKKYRSLEKIMQTDRESQFYTKVLFTYATLGIVIYVSMPRLPSSLRDCERGKSINMIENKIPCGLVCHVRWPFLYLLDDETVELIYAITYAHQIFLVTTITWVIIILTTLMCSIVIQLVNHFRQLHRMIDSIDKYGPKSAKQLLTCVIYHIEIIHMCQKVNSAFGSQMTMFLILPSFVMSILGFELLIAEMTDFIRFLMHLFGWLCLLFLVCYNGQTLIDESGAVATHCYGVHWYKLPVVVQKNLKMMIMRGQKPEQLNAFNLGYLSFATFLRVISSAYSYFTLLINMKAK